MTTVPTVFAQTENEVLATAAFTVPTVFCSKLSRKWISEGRNMDTVLPSLTVFLPSLAGGYRRTVPTVPPYRGGTGRTVTVTRGTGVRLHKPNSLPRHPRQEATGHPHTPAESRWERMVRLYARVRDRGGCLHSPFARRFRVSARARPYYPPI